MLDLLIFISCTITDHELLILLFSFSEICSYAYTTTTQYHNEAILGYIIVIAQLLIYRPVL